MSKSVKYTIEVEASGAIKTTSEVAKGFEHVEKTSEKASKANKDSAKTTKESAGAMTTLSRALDNTPFAPYIRSIQSVGAGIKTVTASTNMLRLALIALPFVAIATAVMTLFKAFTSTQEGADRLNKILVPLQSVLSVLWGLAQDLSIAIVDAFSDPKQAVKDLWGVIKSQIVNRLGGFISLLGAVGKGLKSAFTLDMDGVKDAAKEAGNLYLQVLTGVEDVVSKVGEGFGNINAEMQRGIDAGNRLVEIDKELEQLKIDQTVPLAEMRREYQELRNIAGDTLVSEEDRLKAGDEALKLLKNIESEEKAVLDLEIERLALKQSLNDTSREEELQLEQLKARYAELEANTISQGRRITRQQSTIISGIQKRGEEEQKANIAYIAGLNDRADQFRQLLKTEEELRQEAIEQQVAGVDYLLEKEILSLEEANAIKAELRRTDNEEEIEEKQIHADSILALEEQLRLQQQLFKEAGTQAERDALAEEIDILNERLEERKKTTAEIVADEKKSQEAIREQVNRTVGEAIAGGIARAKSAKEFGKEIIRVLAREAGVAAAASVFKAVPFPANLILAPIAGAAAQRIIESIAGFADGGIVGGGIPIRRSNGDDQIITAKTGEVILNQRQQDAIGSSTLARAGVPGFNNSVSLDASGFQEAVSNFPQSITVVVDIDETQRKLETKDRNINRTTSLVD